MSEILALAAPPTENKCPSCNIDDFEYRCLECFGYPVFCKACCLNMHKKTPYHAIERWTGECFVKSSLYDLGLVLHLGHQGNHCPSYDEPGSDSFHDPEDAFQDDSVLCIVHTSGVFQSRVRYCNCRNAPTHHIQLLRLQLFPASIINPQTAFTFLVLDHFEIDAMECKTSAMNFFSKLR